MHNRIDCYDCDMSWDGQEVGKLEAKLQKAEGRLSLAKEALEFIAGRLSYRDLDETRKAREALAKIV